MFGQTDKLSHFLDEQTHIAAVYACSDKLLHFLDEQTHIAAAGSCSDKQTNYHILWTNKHTSGQTKRRTEGVLDFNIDMLVTCL